MYVFEASKHLFQQIEHAEPKYAWYFLPTGAYWIVDRPDQRDPSDHATKKKPGHRQLYYRIVVDLCPRDIDLFLKLKRLLFP